MSSPRAHEEVAERARESAELLGDDPAEAVLAKVSEVLAIIDSLDDSAPVATSIGTVRLIDYLPTRVLEIVVHTLDVARLAGFLEGGLELGTAVHLDGLTKKGMRAIRRSRKPAAVVAVARVWASSTSQRETMSRAVKCLSTTVKGGEKVYRCGGATVSHWHDEKEPN